MDSNSFCKFYLIYCRDANSGLRSGKESEAFWWSRIPNDTRVGVGYFDRLRKSKWITFTSHS